MGDHIKVQPENFEVFIDFNMHVLLRYAVCKKYEHFLVFNAQRGVHSVKLLPAGVKTLRPATLRRGGVEIVTTDVSTALLGFEAVADRLGITHQASSILEDIKNKYA